MPGTFAEDLSKQKATYLKAEYAQDKIRQAISQEDTGQITRLFDKAIFTPEATTKAYDSAIIAGKNSGIETHLTSAVNVASRGMFNADRTDLSEELIASIGSENHTKLVAICNKQGVSIVDLVLQAVANVYCQAVCEKQTSLVDNNSKSRDENITDTQNFNNQISNVMNDVIPKIKKDIVFPSIFSQIINYLTSFFKFEDRVTAGSLYSRTKEIQNVIDDTINAIKNATFNNEEDARHIKSAVKEMEKLSNQLEISLEQLLPSTVDPRNGSILPATDEQLNRRLTPQERQKGIESLSRICTDLATTIKDHILPIDHLFINDSANNNGSVEDVNKNNKGLLHQILNIMMSYFYRRKDELPELLKDKSKITKDLYLADPILSEKIKSTLPLSAPSDTVSATHTVMNSCKGQENIFEQMKEIKTKIREVKEDDKQIEAPGTIKTGPQV